MLYLEAAQSIGVSGERFASDEGVEVGVTRGPVVDRSHQRLRPGESHTGIFERVGFRQRRAVIVRLGLNGPHVARVFL